VLVANVAGDRKLDTTRSHGLPSRAIENVPSTGWRLTADTGRDHQA
jgi:hypothetical protein